MPLHPRHQVHPPVVGTRRRYREAGLQHAGPQPSAVLAQNRGVQRATLAGAARRAAARLLRVIVGIVAGPEKPQRGRPPQHFDQRGRMFEKGNRSLRGRRPRYHRVQVGAGALHRVVGAGLAQHGGGREPQRATGPSGRATHARRLLDDQHRQPEVMGGERRGHARTRADHQQIHGRVGDRKAGRDRRVVRGHVQNRIPVRRGNRSLVLISGTADPTSRAAGVKSSS